MNKELAAGIIIVLIAISAVPAGIYISMFMPMYEFSLTDIFDLFTGFPWAKGTLIDTWEKTIQNADGTTQLKLVLEVSSGAVLIQEAEDGLLYSVDGYAGRGGINKYSGYDVRFEETTVNDTLLLNIKVYSGYVEIGIAKEYLSSITIDMSSGVTKIEYSSFDDVDMDITLTSGVLVMDVGYINAEDTKINIEMSSGFFNLDINVTGDFSVGVKGDIENGFVKGNVLGEKLAYGGPFTVGALEPDLSINIYISSGFGNIMVSKG